jgi:hypothetical protein
VSTLRMVSMACALTALRLAAGEPTPGHTYYLAVNGKDSQPGSREEPFGTLAAAVRVLKAGDMLVILPGRHTIGSVTVAFQGVEGRPVTLRGEPGACLAGTWTHETEGQAGRAKPAGSGLFITGEWGIVENLELCNHNNRCVGGVGKHMVLRNLHLHTYSNYGIITNTMEDLRIEDCRIHGSLLEHGIYLTGQNKNVIIRNTEIYDTAINGIHINGDKDENILVENCTFRQCSRDWGACITQMRGAHDITIRNCLFYSNLGHVFTMGGDNTRIIQNTVCQPCGSRKGQVFVVIEPLTHWVVRNNVFATDAPALDVKDKGFLTETAEFENNLYSREAGKELAKYGKEGSGVFDADIRFVRAPGWKDDGADLRLVRDSAGARGAARLADLCPKDRDGRDRVDGGAYGAYAQPAP